MNPKVGVFYVSLLPQFAGQGQHGAWFLMTLVCIHLTLSVLWLTGLAHLASRIAGSLSSRLTSRLERISGAMMVALSLHIALQPAA
ncbi:LysE family transporter [Kitasatospora sp. NPDC028055]|uniref:LysE family transporter n=1 Tax=Kitasatospora sp. NPDC028055 TaxID=3155653 RepID=UPI0033C37383